VQRVLILTDRGLDTTEVPHRIADRLRAYRIESQIFSGVHVEPTDKSMAEAAGYAIEQGPVGRVRGSRRWQLDRHRQGGQPADHLPR
jgi:hypothetical protein